MGFFFSRPDQVPDPLYVVTMVSNPDRYRTRWKLYQDFAGMVECAGVRLITVEVAFGDREFTVTQPDNPDHVQLRTRSVLWHKENALNLGFQRLPADWRYAAWVDADVRPARADWFNETVHMLQKHPVVQMWSEAVDLGPNYNEVQRHRSFAWCYREGMDLPDEPGYSGSARRAKSTWYWHPGFAWAITRPAFDAVGGLIDHAILGSADDHMARSLIGRVAPALHRGLTEAYRQRVLLWQRRAQAYLDSNLGYVPGRIDHFYHGPKKYRRYKSRWNILVDRAFDPDTDLKRNSQGVWELETLPGDARQAALRDDLYRYFTQRQEDSVLPEDAGT